MSDPITLVRWEPWELDGHDCWRCSIRTGHGVLSWTTRYPPGDNPLTVDTLRRIANAAELAASNIGDLEAVARLRRAIENLEAQDE